MAATIKDHLQNAFEDLGADQFKKFKSKLCDRREEPRVRRGTIEKINDAIDLADLMVNTFTSTGAVSVTVQILNAIGSNEIAKELLENTGENAAGSAVPLGGQSAPSVGLISPSGEHFIDQNFTELIQRVNNVNPILDILRQKKVITDEDYSSICGKHSKQDKMRELLMGPIKSAGSKGKDILYEALKENERFLMEDLK